MVIVESSRVESSRPPLLVAVLAERSVAIIEQSRPPPPEGGALFVFVPSFVLAKSNVSGLLRQDTLALTVPTGAHDFRVCSSNQSSVLSNLVAQLGHISKTYCPTPQRARSGGGAHLFFALLPPCCFVPCCCVARQWSIIVCSAFVFAFFRISPSHAARIVFVPCIGAVDLRRLQ
jgi:hypothetical protein